VGFVDDEENGTALAGEVGEGDTKLREETGKAEGGLGLEGEQNLMVESGGRQVGIGEVDEGVEVAVEGVGEGTEGGGLAGADVAGDESGETFLEGEGEAALDLLVATGGEEVRARDRLAERGGAEAVKVIEGSHGHRSPVGGMVRVVRSEWYRVAPG
jgi:hypothetical protein